MPRRAFPLVLASLLLVGAPVLAAGTTRLANPSFEDDRDADGAPDAWGFSHLDELAEGCALTRVPGGVSGAFALDVSVARATEEAFRCAALSSPLPARAGSSYVVVAKARADDAFVDGFVFFLDAEGRLVQSTSFGELRYCPEWCDLRAGGVAPSGAVSMTIRLRGIFDAATPEGHAHFDAIQLNAEGLAG